jgi:hypothetical protein
MLKSQRSITIRKYRRNIHNLAALLSLVWEVSAFFIYWRENAGEIVGWSKGGVHETVSACQEGTVGRFGD